MKSFLATFAITLVTGYVFLFFGGSLIFRSFYGTLVFAALIVSVLIHTLISQSLKIEELQKRLDRLEPAKAPLPPESAQPPETPVSS